MNLIDILLYETGDGGDMAIINDDIAMIESLYQQVYLHLFGGNVEAVTRGDELSGEVRYDYWANPLLFPDTPARQFNSNTERTLNETSLNSVGRIKILRAVELDLEPLKKFADFTSDVQLETINRLVIFVKMKSPKNTDDRTLKLIWDNAKNEIIYNQVI